MDSGSEDNFVDFDVVQQAGFLIEPLENPIIVRALDGKFLTRITHQNSPLHLILSGNHHELISLKLMKSPSAPIVLGHPWLVLHNPHLDWSAGKIINWSSGCQNVCLQSALLPTEGSIPPRDKNLDLSCIPACYHDLAKVFSKDCATSLPSHRPYDCAIDLVPGATYPSGRLYNFSRPERVPGSSWCWFLFLSTNKTRRFAVVLDYCGLNQITAKNKYPLPLLSSAFKPLNGATIFSKLDLRNAHHLVRIREGDEWKTAFNTPLGHFEYLVMPFRLTNAPAVFQTPINNVLRDFLNRFVFFFLDDILIFSCSLEEDNSTCAPCASKAPGESTVCKG